MLLEYTPSSASHHLDDVLFCTFAFRLNLTYDLQ